MLHHFTWHQFLIGAFILTVAWYAGVVFLFFRKEWNQLLNGGKVSTTPALRPEPLGHAWDADYAPADTALEDSLMGKAAEPEGLQTLGMHEFSFAPRKVEVVSVAAPANVEDRVAATEHFPDSETLQGLLPDVLEEIKSVWHTVETNGGDKADFISLFKLVTVKYPKIRGGRHLAALNEWIREHVPFAFSGEELDGLWA
jgi:hypothetical protein